MNWFFRFRRLMRTGVLLLVPVLLVAVIGTAAAITLQQHRDAERYPSEDLFTAGMAELNDLRNRVAQLRADQPPHHVYVKPPPPPPPPAPPEPEAVAEPEAEPSKPPVIVEPDMRLEAILWDPDRPLAILDGVTVEAGSSIDGFTTEQIDRDAVLLIDSNCNEFVLRLYHEKEPDTRL